MNKVNNNMNITDSERELNQALKNDLMIILNYARDKRLESIKELEENELKGIESTGIYTNKEKIKISNQWIYTIETLEKKINEYKI